MNDHAKDCSCSDCVRYWSQPGRCLKCRRPWPGSDYCQGGHDAYDENVTLRTALTESRREVETWKALATKGAELIPKNQARWEKAEAENATLRRQVEEQAGKLEAAVESAATNEMAWFAEREHSKTTEASLADWKRSYDWSVGVLELRDEIVKRLKQERDDARRANEYCNRRIEMLEAGWTAADTYKVRAEQAEKDLVAAHHWREKHADLQEQAEASLAAAKEAAYAEGVTNTEARASKRITELEAIAEKCLDPEYMKDMTKDSVVMAMAKRVKDAEQERDEARDCVATAESNANEWHLKFIKAEQERDHWKEQAADWERRCKEDYRKAQERIATEHELFLVAHRDNLRGATLLMEAKKERDHFKAEAVSAWDGMRKAKNERDSLIASTGEHITVRSELRDALSQAQERIKVLEAAWSAQAALLADAGCYGLYKGPTPPESEARPSGENR